MKPARPVMKRAAALGLILVAGLLGADYTVWRIATDRLRRAYGTWQTSLAASGWQVRADPVVAVGWPIAARLRLDHARLGVAAADGFAWTAARLSFGVSLLRPHAIVLAATGAETLSGPGWGPVRFAAKQLELMVPREPQPGSASISARDLAIASRSGDLLVQRARLTLAWQADHAALELTAGPIALPAGTRWGLGPSVDQVTLDLIDHGAWPGATPGQAAAAWRAGGGRLDVAQLGVHWGTLQLDGTGSLRLDADLQPRGALDLHIGDPAAALSTLADAGAISRGAATAATAVLDLLAAPARIAGQSSGVALPLELKGGTVSLGRIPIAQLAPVAWR